MAIEFEINRPDPRPFRRAFIKRRSSSTGLYEASWFEITKYIKKWSSIDRSVDDLRLNRFTHSGFSVAVRNDTGAFNLESNQNSIWNGYMTRYRTLVRIEGGYFDSDQVELPTDSAIGVFIITDEIPISGVSNQATLRAKSLVSVFDEVRVADVAGINSTQTADSLITKIRDHTDGASNFYFRQFITSTSWTIQSTSAYYNVTSTVIGSMTCWEFMEKLAEAEGYLLMINRSGGLEFRNRDERTTTSQFSFLGQGFNPMNIIALEEHKEAYNKLFTFFRLKYLEADTSTSYVTAGSTSSVDPSSTAWKYGSRVYNFETTFLNNTTAAQNIVNSLASTFSVVKEELTLRTKFCPHLEVSDKVAVSYRSYSVTLRTFWDLFSWDSGTWAGAGGENFDLNAVSYKILSVNHNLEKLFTTFKVRAL